MSPEQRQCLRGGESLKVKQDTATGDATPCPLLDADARSTFADLGFSHAIVKTMLRVPEMPDPIPLRRALRVEVIVNIIENIGPPPLDRMLQSCRLKSGGLGCSNSQFIAKTWPVFTSRAAAATRSGVSRLSVPTWSSSPKTAQANGVGNQI